ncbi:hypothetical protein DL766_005879 [Monosporascus sp. MC13-8B]|nr:hypothetical protein DL763_005843 [Monosporascus cannonballus]RYP28381.1 hypothetical protein DL766_005879 [Monosporascus sp. MC13-8B]
MMAPLYKKALIIGATSGIGEALAAKLLDEGTSVIITGRRQDRLDAFLSKHGSANVSTVALDITKLSEIPSFAASIIGDHPDLDCVVLNSGIQRAFNFAKPETVDLGVFGEELTTNYLSFVHLATAFLPHLQRLGRGKETHLVFVGASLALIPSLLRTPGYNASKAALHSWVMAVRQQLKEGGHNVRLVEVFPPAVQTELHDTKHQPDMQNGRELGMPLQPFIERMYAELEKGDEQFAIGPAEAWLAEGGFEAERQKLFQQQHVVVTASVQKFLK